MRDNWNLAMITVFVLCMIIILMAGIAQADITTAPVDNIARINIGSGSGTGFILGDGIMVTAKHVTEKSTSLYPVIVNYSDGTTEIVDCNAITTSKIYDISYFPISKETDRKLVVSQEELTMGTPVYVLSMPFSYDFVYGSVGVVGTDVINILPWLCIRVTDIHAVPGMSGGPILNNDDEVVGIVSATSGTLVMILDVDILRRFLP